jgi:hypothetical protein
MAILFLLIKCNNSCLNPTPLENAVEKELSNLNWIDVNWIDEWGREQGSPRGFIPERGRGWEKTSGTENFSPCGDGDGRAIPDGDFRVAIPSWDPTSEAATTSGNALMDFGARSLENPSFWHAVVLSLIVLKNYIYLTQMQVID